MPFDGPTVFQARRRPYPFGISSTPCPRTAATALHRPGARHSARPPPVRDRTTDSFAWGRRRATSASLLGFVRALDFFWRAHGAELRDGGGVEVVAPS